MIRTLVRLLRRRRKPEPEPTFEERIFAMFDEGDFLKASNALRDTPARGGIGNAYYEYVYRWRIARGHASDA